MTTYETDSYNGWLDDKRYQDEELHQWLQMVAENWQPVEPPEPPPTPAPVRVTLLTTWFAGCAGTVVETLPEVNYWRVNLDNGLTWSLPARFCKVVAQ